MPLVSIAQTETVPRRAATPPIGSLPPLPRELAGPVEVALTKSVDTVPGPHALSGGCAYEPKWDGYRACIVRAGPTGDGAAGIWSRQGKDLTSQFPDVVAAAVEQLPDGCVVDGELVALDATGRLSFDLLQRRLVTARGQIRRVAAEHPSSFMAFDLLAVAGVDVRSQRWTTRRARLEGLATWSPPLQLSPVTDDVDEARDWFDVLPAAMGVEGLVVKGRGTRYLPGRREWLKVKHRDTVEVLVGGVLGLVDRPDVVIAARYAADGRLVNVGRSVALTAAQAVELGALLTPAGEDHPWPDELGVGRWQSSTATVPLTKVEPITVVEISADAALQAGGWRHPVRYLRPRVDLQPDDVPTLP